jgi:hypothetical protein
MSDTMKSDLAQWVFDILRARAARGDLPPFAKKIMNAVQQGHALTSLAYIEILEQVRQEMEREHPGEVFDNANPDAHSPL